MNKLLDSFWRATLYCLHPRVIALSFLPVILMCLLLFGAFYFFWDTALDTVRGELSSLTFLQPLMNWLGSIGKENLRVVIAPLLVLALSIPLIVVVCLLAVSVLMTPAMVALVAERRFPNLERKHGASFLFTVVWSLGSTLVALVAMVVSLPFWLFPLFILVLPPLIWGWLTYRVMAFDALANHASSEERREIFKTHRATLLAMGVVAGYLGAAPTLLWAWGALTIAMAPFLLPVAIWLYTLVFAFSSLWFSHHCLAALTTLRAGAGTVTGRADGLKPTPPADSVSSGDISVKALAGAAPAQNAPPLPLPPP